MSKAGSYVFVLYTQSISFEPHLALVIPTTELLLTVAKEDNAA